MPTSRLLARLLAAAGLAAATLCAPPAHAQAAPGTPVSANGFSVPGLAVSSPAPGSAAAQAADNVAGLLHIKQGVILDEGGKMVSVATLGKCAEYIQGLLATASIVVSPEAYNINIGDLLIPLSQSQITIIAEALRTAAAQQINYNTSASPDGKVGLFFSAAPAPARTIAVYNLSAYLNADPSADEKSANAKLNSLTQLILDTLHTLNPSVPVDQQASFEFHPGAGLLVVIGTPDAQDTAGKIVQALYSSPFLPQHLVGNKSPSAGSTSN
jgi:hypothetical protein